MHDQEKSDSAIVAVKSPNKTGFPVAEAMERRAGTKGNADRQSTHRTQIRARVTQALGRVRQADQRFAVNTQGRSRMLESGSSGSVRGVLSNEHPYREPGTRVSSNHRRRWESRKLWDTGSSAGACHRAARCADPVADDDGVARDQPGSACPQTN
jgi:hypothetical protein